MVRRLFVAFAWVSVVGCQFLLGIDTDPPILPNRDAMPDSSSSPDANGADASVAPDGADDRLDAPKLQDTPDVASESAAQDSSDAAATPDAAEGSVQDACVGSDAQATPRIIYTGFLDIGTMMTWTQRTYAGPFQLGPCEHLANGNASEFYTQDTSTIPPVTTGLSILHTFEPAGPYMTPPATQPAGKYSISNVSLAYDATIDTYTWSFYGINYVFWPCTPSSTCKSVDDAMYRVVIDVVQ